MREVLFYTTGGKRVYYFFQKGVFLKLERNIERNFPLHAKRSEAHSAVIVTSDDIARRTWQRRLKETGPIIFDPGLASRTFVLKEERPGKKTQGSFLGALSAWAEVKEKIFSYPDVPDGLILMGMDVGKGKRLSPITQSNGCSKASLAVTPKLFQGPSGKMSLNSLELALFYCAPLVEYLKKREFKGVLIKWGDEIQLPSVDMDVLRNGSSGAAEIVKFVSAKNVSPDMAENKDWVFYEKGSRRVEAFSPRASFEEVSVRCHQAREKGSLPAVSLGPVAVSFDLLDTGLEIFGSYIRERNVQLDFDPYLFMALLSKKRLWESIASKDPFLGQTLAKAPDLFERAQDLKSALEKKNGRVFKIEAADLGKELLWADMGGHKAMREAFLAWTKHDPMAASGRLIAGLNADMGEGGMVIDSSVDEGIVLENSIVVNSIIRGSGRITGSVVVESRLTDPHMSEAFSFNSFRFGKTFLGKKSGLYNSIGSCDLTLEEGMRHVSVLTGQGRKDLLVSEDLDLKEKNNYEKAVLGNELSFSEAFDIMERVSHEELEMRKEKEIMKLDRVRRKKEKFRALRFGTSGLRDEVSAMTDMECCINTRGFLNFLRKKGELAEGGKIALGGDRRPSTRGIMRAVAEEIRQSGCQVLCCGLVPSPLLANYAREKGIPSIMVTGSHIPAGRNGIKFTKTSGEVLKSDEKEILLNVDLAREEEYAKSDEESLFDEKGYFKQVPESPEDLYFEEAVELYISRYVEAFGSKALEGDKMVFYQHSAVGRDVVEKIFKRLGAEIIAVGRSEEFVPVDTEKVDAQRRRSLRSWAREHKASAVVSTDGDSDRPLFCDETGEVLPGDKLGALVSLYLNPDFAAVPVSSNDAVISALETKGVELKLTKIGSPYVIKAMLDKLGENASALVVGWEANGGFLLGSDWEISGKKLKALPTRDAVLPIVCAMLLSKQRGLSLSRLIDEALPHRYTASDVVDDKMPGCSGYTPDVGRGIIEMLSGKNIDGSGGPCETSERSGKTKELLERCFKEAGFSRSIKDLDFTDGVRMVFDNEEVVHLRPSGNAPEFRVYATAESPERAQELVDLKSIVLPWLMDRLEE